MMKPLHNILIAGMLFCLTTSYLSPGTPPPADEVVKQACQEAAVSHKKVLVIFHASWCGWCHKLDTLLNSPECKGFFDKSYVIRHLTILESKDKKDLENPGAQELYDKYASKDSGIPFFLVIDADGKVEADSRIKKDGIAPTSSGDNTGFPSTSAEVAYFMRLLQATTTLTTDQLAVIQGKLTQQ